MTTFDALPIALPMDTRPVVVNVDCREDCGACSDRMWAEEAKCCPWVRDGGALYTCEMCRAAKKHIGRCQKGKANKSKEAIKVDP